ncbi:putative uncharacterized protein DDB_G0282133 isoform X2 [Coccinella septempunctata]|uniref:putative uncharacterized protein DDB_G0282133 isoform X2 n=1 Tax=Coccinella septempunctata TaxID=41139 RepID=UPI001D08BACF|nr:putative uncharacterized protein DDB_G0282133 isoform X2 [Coccinella septempunctata]
MSTFSSIGSKGGKPKFQSLDINRIYKSSRGESSEKTQQKSTIQYKHGMQILGKVPNARRPPANLPSLKSEHSGSEAAVPLVPPGGPGWGKQDTNSLSNGLPTPKQDQNPAPTLHQSAQSSQPAPLKQEVPHVPSAPIDKSWSSVMSRGDTHSHHPPPYQGPQFQHDFPSLSATEGGQGRGTGTEPPYSTGLSLRPQTEGSWIGGGSGPGGEGKPTSGHLGSPPQLSAQAGLLQQQQQQTLPPQYRGVMPSFMYKNNPPSANAPPSLTANNVIASSHDNNGRQDKINKKSFDEVVPPSIIKEEELHRMDEIERDMGWAYSDDIDYNKKLNFSDDEILTDKSSRPKQTDIKHHEKLPEVAKKETNDAWQTSNKGHSSEEEEIKLKRSQHFKEVELAVQRAKQRKKEEEKRFNEATKQGAQQKLKELEEKISKRDRDGEEGVGTINPSIVPPKPIAPTEIPLPDFQREKDPPHHKEKEERHKIPAENHEEKIEKPSNTFKHLTEIEGKTFKRNSKNPERESREQGAPTFSRQFQSDLPPRFKRQHHQQNNPPQYNEHYENRSPVSPNYPKSNMSRKPLIGPSETEPRKRNIDEPTPISQTPQEPIHKSESPANIDTHDLEVSKHKKETRIQEEKYDKAEPDIKDYERRDYGQARNRSEAAPSDIKPKLNKNQDNLYDRFQRLDSQDAKISRDKYTSDDNREYSSWSESRFDISFEEKRREVHREDRRQVPGPITRDRIEADDFNESRNLTALKRGQIPEKKPNGVKNKEERMDSLDGKKSDPHESKTCTDQSDKSKNVGKKDDKDVKSVDNKKNIKNDDYRDDKRNSSRSKAYPSNKVWNNEYHHRSTGERGNWPKRSNSSNKNSRSNVGHKMESFSNIATDSEGSSEDHHSKDDHSHKNVKSDKINKNHPKEEKRNTKSDRDRQSDKMQDIKRDNYVPRGEPSRLGRGGGNFRGRVGLSKRIDGYGPPPSKSPFTHHDDKKPNENDDNQQPNTNAAENDKDSQVEVKEDNNVFSENKTTDDKDKSKVLNNKTAIGSKPNNSNANSSVQRKPNQQSRSINEKKHFVKNETSITTQNKQSKPEDSNMLCSAIADISLKNKDDLGGDVEEEGLPHGDSDGFQEVKSKKTVKERPRTEEKLNPPYPGKNLRSDNKEREKNKKQPIPQQIQQPTHNIPPLMAVTVNPPHVLPQTNKNQFDRQSRQNKIPPRFVKLRESNRLQKMQQQHGMADMNEIKNRNMFGPKMSNPQANNPVVPISNAWDKPLGTQLRPMEPENLLATAIDGGNNIEHGPAQGNPDVDKKINKSNLSETVILDGATPPVNTIIFENTNFKSMPTNRNVRNDKLRKEDGSLENPSMTNFNKRMNDLLSKNEKQSDSIQLQLPFKEDSGDMKLDFFDSALSLPDEKALKNPCLPRPMHSMTTGGNDISTADALNYKIQSVKKVWETPSEHGVPQEDANPNFSTSFVPDTNTLDSNSYVKGNDNVEDNHEQHGYSPAANQQTSNNTTNVCKVEMSRRPEHFFSFAGNERVYGVKPTQQVSGAANQAVSGANAAHPAHSGIMGPGLMGNPLSPPPIQPVIGAGVGIGQPPQQFPTNQHMGYQTSIGSRSQYGMSAIPSPPSVLPYTAPPLQAQTANLYGPFQIDQTGVLGGQGRSQFSQYPNHYGLGQAASSPYTAQSMFLQTPQAHPPPAAQGPEIYQNLNSYRLSNAAFGQNQQLNNPTTVLISSTSNSLMSATVKPSTQQISAIGTKSGGVGQAYQQQSQQGQQMYMFDPNLQANYLQGLQRPTGPVQNNVVPTIQPSSSYYSGSTPAAKPFNCSWGY